MAISTTRGNKNADVVEITEIGCLLIFNTMDNKIWVGFLRVI